jgi:hypothetical protein
MFSKLLIAFALIAAVSADGHGHVEMSGSGSGSGAGAGSSAFAAGAFFSAAGASLFEKGVGGIDKYMISNIMYINQDINMWLTSI